MWINSKSEVSPLNSLNLFVLSLLKGSQVGSLVAVPALHLCGPRFDSRTGALHVDVGFQSLTDCVGFYGFSSLVLKLQFLRRLLNKKHLV